MSTAFYLGQEKIKNFTIAVDEGIISIVLKNPATEQHILEGRDAIVNGKRIQGKMKHISDPKTLTINGLSDNNNFIFESAFYSEDIKIIFDEDAICALLDAI